MPVIRASHDRESYSIYKSLVLNPGGLAKPSSKGAKKIHLILTHEKYTAGLERLLQFKKTLGHEVRLETLNQPDTAVVKALIKKNYQSAEPPTDTLIVGSIDDIPSFRSSGFWSDYPYSLLDNGDFPDISLGRFPVKDTNQLGRVIDKVIARETQTRDKSNFLVTSGYEVDWCQENLKYIMNRIFSKSDIPIRVTKLYASDGAHTSQVVDGYNSNPNIIIYDGHGDQDSMSEIPLRTSDFSKFTNTVNPLLFDIACLNSYWPSSGAS